MQRPKRHKISHRANAVQMCLFDAQIAEQECEAALQAIEGVIAKVAAVVAAQPEHKGLAAAFEIVRAQRDRMREQREKLRNHNAVLARLLSAVAA